jgi:hypothetical protein
LVAVRHQVAERKEALPSEDLVIHAMEAMTA